MTRDEFIKVFCIRETALGTLVHDLLALPDSKTNRTILHNALNGVYSNFKSKLAAPVMTLISHLREANNANSGYHSLLQKARMGSYDHNKGAEIPSGSPPLPDIQSFMDQVNTSPQTILQEGFRPR